VGCIAHTTCECRVQVHAVTQTHTHTRIRTDEWPLQSVFSQALFIICIPLPIRSDPILRHYDYDALHDAAFVDDAFKESPGIAVPCFWGNPRKYYNIKNLLFSMSKFVSYICYNYKL